MTAPANKPDAPAGPLHRRIATGAQPLPVARPAEPDDRPVDAPHDERAYGYATLGLLDGTIVARMPCGPELGVATIGRGSLAEIRLHDNWVHRAHATIRWDSVARAHVISDLGGANGTFVNLERVRGPVRLIDGARVRLGKTELVYHRIWYSGS